MPDGPRSASARTSARTDLAELRALPHATRVHHADRTVVVDGGREVIAHVGAWLVERGAVPPDLHVDVPDLEGALLALLDGGAARHPGHGDRRHHDHRRSTPMTTTTAATAATATATAATAATAAAAGAGTLPRHAAGRPAQHGLVRRLVATELRLLRREPVALTFVVAFPILTMLIIGGSFGTTPDAAFEGTNPAHWYVASYVAVGIGAMGLVVLPVHIAGYRERGVLRRFAVAGFPRRSFALAQLVVGVATIAVSTCLQLAVAAPVYGLPSPHQLGRVVAGGLVGAVAFVSIGVVLGTLARSARSAQAIGLLLFFPSFLLGVGGPPPEVMGSQLRAISGVLPLAVVTRAIRDPWLGLGSAGGALLAVGVLAVAATAVAVRRSALEGAPRGRTTRPWWGRRCRRSSGSRRWWWSASP